MENESVRRSTHLKPDFQDRSTRTYGIRRIIVVDARIIGIYEVLSIRKIIAIQGEFHIFIDVVHAAIPKDEIPHLTLIGSMVKFAGSVNGQAEGQDEIQVGVIEHTDNRFRLRGI